MNAMAQNTDLYSYSFTDIDGNEVSMSQFKGKKILIVNVASKCGYTPQYEDLQKLHAQYGDKVVLIGFPCNQFLKQEPGDEAEIKEFCQKNYGVEFLMASKIDVKGNEQHPIYTWLTTKEMNGIEDSKVGWNFQKYLIDENGKYLEKFEPGVNPLDEELTSKL
jgi:glutathione peroxidase